MIEFLEAETQDDCLQIAKLADSIWREHYIPIIGVEQVNYMLHKYQSASAIAEQLKDGVKYYLFGKDNFFLSYLSFYKTPDALFLSKIYVKKTARGEGLGKAGINFVLAKATEFGFDKVRLTVNKYNSNTIAAYEKMGFVKVDSVVADIGGGYVMDDFVMELTLAP